MNQNYINLLNSIVFCGKFSKDYLDCFDENMDIFINDAERKLRRIGQVFKIWAKKGKVYVNKNLMIYFIHYKLKNYFTPFIFYTYLMSKVVLKRKQEDGRYTLTIGSHGNHK